MSCFNECVRLKKEFPSWDIKKVFNKNDQWLSHLGYYVEHIKGAFIIHYVIQNGEFIIDLFLTEIGPIKVEEYLDKYYHNSKELDMVGL